MNTTEYKTKTSLLREIDVYLKAGGRQVAIAYYTYDDYSGDVYVLGYNKQNKQFFEVYGSPCSCDGLEGQWEEEYYEDVKQLQATIEKRFEGRSDYSRYAYSSDEFKSWMEG